MGRGRRSNNSGGIGCLPAVAASFALGVVLAVTRSYGIVVVMLALFLIAVVLASYYC